MTQTIAPVFDAVNAPVRQIVQRQPAGGAFAIDYHLLCLSVRCQDGARMGEAVFAQIPFTAAGESPSFEDRLAYYTIDDRVRVDIFPPGVAGNVDANGQQKPVRIFDGYLARHTVDLQDIVGQKGGGSEKVGFVALPMAILDDRDSRRIIRGRWGHKQGETGNIDTATVLESPGVPACFNRDGRPNRHPSIMLNVTFDVSPVTVFLFTHDDDPSGQPWTASQAIAAIFAQWIIKSGGDRYCTLAAETVALLTSGANDAALNMTLPEVDVTGLGALSAIDKVCKACGHMLILESTGIINQNADDQAYPYTLRIVQRGVPGSRQDTFDLAKRTTDYSAVGNAQQLLQENNLSKFVGMRNGAEIVNEVYAVAPLRILCRLNLLPLWDPADADPEALDPIMQYPILDKLWGSGYHAKHIEGGILYRQYLQVGRKWGVDCTGTAKGFSSGAYAHPGGGNGFDFVGSLGINSSALASYRQVSNITDPIAWTNRIRRLLPMQHPEAQLHAIDFFLEVSEDSGSTWRKAPCGFSSLSAECGIFLSVPNLAAFNISAHYLGYCDVNASWWGLLKTGTTLRFRITCEIEADHAVAYKAPRRPDSGTTKTLGVYRAQNLPEIWLQPGTYINPGGDWAHVAPLGVTNQMPPLYSLKQVADRRQAALDDPRTNALCSTWMMDFGRYRLGDIVTGIRGREYSFRRSGGGVSLYPNVAQITYRLGATGQAIEVHLDDNRLFD